MRSSGHPLDLFEFLSTPSARRATDEVKANNALIEISIHALREEGDAMMVMVPSLLAYFYPRPPRGGRPPCSVRSTP